MDRRMSDSIWNAKDQTDVRTYVIDTDASDYGLGAFLSQKQDALLQGVSFIMRRREKNYWPSRTDWNSFVRIYLAGILSSGPTMQLLYTKDAWANASVSKVANAYQTIRL